MLHLAFLISALAADPSTVATDDVVFPPAPGGAEYHVDAAGLLDEDAKRAIDVIGAALWEDERAPITVVTIPSLEVQHAEHMTLEIYARELFDRWRVGGERSTFGILIVVSPGDRDLHVELGPGWGDAKRQESREIIDEIMVPRFANGDASTAIRDGVKGYDAMARGLPIPRPTSPGWLVPFVVVSFIFLMALTMSLSRSGRLGWGWATLVFVGTSCATICRAAAARARKKEEDGATKAAGATGSW